MTRQRQIIKMQKMYKKLYNEFVFTKRAGFIFSLLEHAMGWDKNRPADTPF